MSDTINYFSDLIEQGETIRSTLAGPGASVDGASVWFQLAVTEKRILVIELRARPGSGWQPVRREAAALSAIHIARHTRTEADPSRLVIEGLQAPFIMVDIDREDVFPMVEPLIVAWGGRLGGTGAGRPDGSSTSRTTDSPLDRIPAEQRKPLVIGAGCLALLSIVCATAGCLSSIVRVLGGPA